MARARQTGKTVKELRGEEQREEAASVLDRLLAEDKEAHYGLSNRTRWALHLAIGVLRGRRDERDEL